MTATVTPMNQSAESKEIYRRINEILNTVDPDFGRAPLFVRIHPALAVKATGSAVSPGPFCDLDNTIEPDQIEGYWARGVKQFPVAPEISLLEMFAKIRAKVAEIDADIEHFSNLLKERESRQ